MRVAEENAVAEVAKERTAAEAATKAATEAARAASDAARELAEAAAARAIAERDAEARQRREAVEQAARDREVGTNIKMRTKYAVASTVALRHMGFEGPISKPSLAAPSLRPVLFVALRRVTSPPRLLPR